MNTRAERQRGIVLLNALILVLAISAMAAGLLALAVRGTTRLAYLQDATQAAKYLTSGEVLVTQALEADWEAASDVDHRGEIWGAEDYVVPIDRGTLAGRIDDLQSRFNINWLTDAEDLEARRAFERLATGLGLNVQLAHAVTEFMRPGGPANPTPYFNRTLPVRPVGGRIHTVSELRAVSGMTTDIFETLAPYLAALPPDSALNVNTASAPVLAALLPAAGQYNISELLDLRDAEPFQSPADFREIARQVVRPDLFEDMEVSRFDVRSEWFEARLEVALDGPVRRRMIYLHRPNTSGKVTRQFGLDLP